MTDLVSTWFTRSGAVPIDIYMMYSQTCEVECDISPLLSVLVSASRRWKNIQIIFRAYDLTHLFPLSSDDVPLLQHMSLSDRARRLVGQGSPRPIIRKPVMLLGSESFRSVAIPCDRHFLQSPILWGSLKKLIITQGFETLDYDTAWTILRQCHMLETCELPVSVQRTPRNTPPPQQFPLPHLSHLSIYHSQIPTAEPHFLARIILPMLPSFHCQRILCVPVQMPRLTPLFPSTFSQLECFTVDIPVLSTELLLDALSDMPSLQELGILREPVLVRGTSHPDPDFLAHLI
ncbi:hypothetical protein C8R44DRAFT_667154, partial [Mycena epipterygia]